VLTSEQIRLRNCERRQRLVEQFSAVEPLTVLDPGQVTLALLFTVADVGGELCAQLAELREAIESKPHAPISKQSHQPHSMEVSE
jgi:predicted metalloendopeptidase